MLRRSIVAPLLGLVATAGASTSDACATEAALSIGSPTDGALRGGVAIEERDYLALRWPDGPRWGLPSMIRMLDRAAARVSQKHQGSVLLVGELSRQRGGELPGHASHESGRDADVAMGIG